jgi:DNA-binding MarR family transcriptional regulator
VQFVLLASLTWLSGEDMSGAPVTQRVLADHAATDPMMTSQVVRVLEGRGWLTRETHPADRRAVALEVTEAGVALVRRANAAVEQCDEEFFAALGARRSTLTVALRTLRDAHV